MYKAVREPDVAQQFDNLGIEGVGMKPDEFAAFVVSEHKAALEIARRINTGARK